MTENSITNAVVHLNVPKPLKAKWVNSSQKAGLTLSQWLLPQINRELKPSITDVVFEARTTVDVGGKEHNSVVGPWGVTITNFSNQVIALQCCLALNQTLNDFRARDENALK